MKKIITLLALCSCIGCGGGGGEGNNNSLNVSGLWTGAITKVSDTCTPASAQTINFSHRVAQNEDAVTLVNESSLEFIGNIVGEDGFSVDAASSAAVNPAICQDHIRIKYNDINDDNDTTAHINITTTRSCSSVSCEIAYTGTASRVSTVPNAPTPTPVVSTSNSGNGCFAINLKPAAGTYSGDGGCGLSQVQYSIQSNSIILEPFGANGATSFTVSSANSSSAASQNTNLIILGENGYSCSLTCSPPLTFTVQCFREGGTTCTEKF